MVEVVSDAKGTSMDAARRSRVLTVPNAITVVRLCCIPVFLHLLIAADDRVAAALLLGGLGATDWVDGWVARRFGQVSELGKVLDPTADRLLFIAGVGGIIVAGAAPLWFAWAVVVRELLVGGAMVVATLAGMQRFDVTWWGKTATFLLMFAVPAFVLGSSDIDAAPVFQWIGWVLGIPGLALSWYTAACYAPMIRENLRAGRRARHEPEGRHE